MGLQGGGKSGKLLQTFSRLPSDVILNESKLDWRNGGKVHDDPVVFAINDKVSRIVNLVALALMMLHVSSDREEIGECIFNCGDTWDRYVIGDCANCA